MTQILKITMLASVGGSGLNFGAQEDVLAPDQITVERAFDWIDAEFAIPADADTAFAFEQWKRGGELPAVVTAPAEIARRAFIAAQDAPREPIVPDTPQEPVDLASEAEIGPDGEDEPEETDPEPDEPVEEPAEVPEEAPEEQAGETVETPAEPVETAKQRKNRIAREKRAAAKAQK